MDKVGIVSEQNIFIKSTVEKATEITKDDAKTMQDEKDVQMKVPMQLLKKNTVPLNQWEKHH